VKFAVGAVHQKLDDCDFGVQGVTTKFPELFYCYYTCILRAY
jgi:hypothetical protein